MSARRRLITSSSPSGASRMCSRCNVAGEHHIGLRSLHALLTRTCGASPHTRAARHLPVPLLGFKWVGGWIGAVWGWFHAPLAAALLEAYPTSIEGAFI